MSQSMVATEEEESRLLLAIEAARRRVMRAREHVERIRRALAALNLEEDNAFTDDSKGHVSSGLTMRRIDQIRIGISLLEKKENRFLVKFTRAQNELAKATKTLATLNSVSMT